VAKRERLAEGDFPEPGSVFVAPTADGRLAAGRVLRRQVEGGDCAALVAGSAWIGHALPPLDLSTLRAPLVLTHHSWRGQRNLFWTHLRMPAEFRIIGQLPLSNDDSAEFSDCFGGWQSVPLQALAQWRWDHDREALLREEAATLAAETERRRQVARVREDLLRTLSLKDLAERRWLDSWSGTAAEPHQADVRQVLCQLVHDLQGEVSRTKAKVRKLLKQAIGTLNQLDTRQPFITTIEREDLCAAFEQIACASGFPPLADEVNQWRKW